MGWEESSWEHEPETDFFYVHLKLKYGLALDKEYQLDICDNEVRISKKDEKDQIFYITGDEIYLELAQYVKEHGTLWKEVDRSNTVKGTEIISPEFAEKITEIVYYDSENTLYDFQILSIEDSEIIREVCSKIQELDIWYEKEKECDGGAHKLVLHAEDEEKELLFWSNAIYAEEKFYWNQTDVNLEEILEIIGYED